jgi:hypothetical protein
MPHVPKSFSYHIKRERQVCQKILIRTDEEGSDSIEQVMIGQKRDKPEVGGNQVMKPLQGRNPLMMVPL